MIDNLNKFIRFRLSPEAEEYLNTVSYFGGDTNTSRKIRYILDEHVQSTSVWTPVNGKYWFNDIDDAYKNPEFKNLGIAVNLDKKHTDSFKTYLERMLFNLESLFVSHRKPTKSIGFRVTDDVWQLLSTQSIPSALLVDCLILRHKFFSTMSDQESHYYHSWMSALRSSTKIGVILSTRILQIASILGAAEDTYISSILLRYILTSRTSTEDNFYYDNPL